MKKKKNIAENVNVSLIDQLFFEIVLDKKEKAEREKEVLVDKLELHLKGKDIVIDNYNKKSLV